MKRFINKTDISYQLSNLRQIVFEVTDACNLRCKYCSYGEFYDDYDKRENKNLAIEDAIAILDYLIQFWQSEQNVSFNKNVYLQRCTALFFKAKRGISNKSVFIYQLFPLWICFLYVW